MRSKNIEISACSKKDTLGIWRAGLSSTISECDIFVVLRVLWLKWSLLSVMEWWDPPLFFCNHSTSFSLNSFNLPTPHFSKQLTGYERDSQGRKSLMTHSLCCFVWICVSVTCYRYSLSWFSSASRKRDSCSDLLAFEWENVYLMLTVHRLVHNLQHLPGCGTESRKMCCSKLI